MAPSNLLKTLKKPQLKATALLMGLPSSGNIAELHKVIQHGTITHPPMRTDSCIVSVDMGIKNLGICVLGAPHLADTTSPRMRHHGVSPAVRVVKWQTINVLERLQLLTRVNGTLAEEVPAQTTTVNAKTFRPSILSKAALDVAKDIWAFDPSQVLIENQRFRSGGGAAVQEWTLRVNALESMLWACFQTLGNASAEDVPEIHEISPKQVANFWCARPYQLSSTVSEEIFGATWKHDDEVSEKSKRTVDKKEKIALVRSWLAAEDGKPHEDVTLELSPEVQTIAEAFLTQGRKTRRKQSDTVSTSTQPSGKLDDLADCMLQGVAWVRWEENRRKIHKMLGDPSDLQESGLVKKRRAG